MVREFGMSGAIGPLGFGGDSPGYLGPEVNGAHARSSTHSDHKLRSGNTARTASLLSGFAGSHQVVQRSGEFVQFGQSDFGQLSYEAVALTG